MATGEVITQCKPGHRYQEFLGFLRQIEKSVPEDLDVHLIVENYCTHKHAKVRAWLAQRPRFHVHYTPQGLLEVCPIKPGPLAAATVPCVGTAVQPCRSSLPNLPPLLT